MVDRFVYHSAPQQVECIRWQLDAGVLIVEVDSHTNDVVQDMHVCMSADGEHVVVELVRTIEDQ